MKIPGNLQDSFGLFNDSYGNLFKAFKNRKESEQFSELEFDGVIHRVSSLKLFAVDFINKYLVNKGLAIEGIKEEETIELAYKHKIIANKETWLAALNKIRLFPRSHDPKILAEIIYFINEVFQRIIIDLYEHFIAEFK